MSHEERFKLAKELILAGKANEEIFPIFREKYPEDYNEKVFGYQLDAMRRMFKEHKNTDMCPTCGGLGRVQKKK